MLMKALRKLLPFLLIVLTAFCACTRSVPVHIIDIAPSEPAYTAAPTDAPTANAETPSLITPTPDLTETPEPPETYEPTPEPTETLTAVPTQPPTAAPTPAPTPAPTNTQPPATAQPTNPPSQEVYSTFDPNNPRPQDGSRFIYLTFDDGPCPNTLRVLDILDQYGAKATFFTVGYFVDRYPEIAAETVRRGQLIACHSYTHDFNQCYASAEAFINEVHHWEEAVINACGRLPWRVCVRFPGGSKTATLQPIRDQVMALLRAGGYRWFDWNTGDNDKWPAGNVNNLPKEEYLMQSYLQSISWYDRQPGNNIIFLCHDTEDATVSVLPRILQDLVNRGYVFRTLDEHPDWNN